MAKPLAPLAEFVCDQLGGWAPVAARRLFGGWGIYRGPVMFGLIARDTIYFRVDDGNRADYAAAATRPFLHAARERAANGEMNLGPRPFTYRMSNGKTIEMAYYEVPAEILDDPEMLAEWAGKAHAAAMRASAAKARKRPAAAPARPRPRQHTRAMKTPLES